MEKFTFQNITEAEEAFEHLQKYAESYKLADMQKELDMIQPKLKLEHKIAIIGNENAGKSTFIKAVFGEEIPTESTLSDADIALFVLDYEQLDTNLENDEQGLWHTIQERVAKDKDFVVFFIINKIDIALNNTKSKGEWSVNKTHAANKLKDVAIRYGIQNPQIYSVSSLYYLLKHKTNKNFDEKNKLWDFENKFMQGYDSKGEGEFIKYIGIDNFKKEWSDYIKDKPQKHLDELASKMQEIISNERERINKEIESLQHQDKDNTKKDKLQHEKERLEERRKSIEVSIEKSHGEKGEMPEKIELLENRLNELEQFYSGKIEKLVDGHIQKDMLNPIDEITKKTLAFVEHYAAGHNKILSKLHAKTNAAKMTIEKKNIFCLTGISKLPEEMEEESETEEMVDKLGTEVYDKFSDIRLKICDFIKEMLIDCKNNYTNIHDEMREIYQEIDSKLSSSIEISNNALEKHKEEKSTAKWWNPATWFDSKKVEEHTMIIKGIKAEIDIDSILSFDIEISGSFIPKSNSFDVKTSDGILKYHLDDPYEEVSTATLNPLTWGDSKFEKTKDEEHYIIVNGIKLKNAIEQKVLENIEKLKNAEMENWQDNIEQIKENIKELPSVSNSADKEQSNKLSLEIDEINKQIHDIDQQLHDIEKQNKTKENKQKERENELRKQLEKLKENPLWQH
ncbi:MAG: hypothetical protein K2F85_06520 [Helicobacter sp.]|nr:hypothetical protein [Helicobacter sp.]